MIKQKIKSGLTGIIDTSIDYYSLLPAVSSSLALTSLLKIHFCSFLALSLCIS